MVDVLVSDAILSIKPVKNEYYIVFKNNIGGDESVFETSYFNGMDDFLSSLDDIGLHDIIKSDVVIETREVITLNDIVAAADRAGVNIDLDGAV